MPRDDRAAPAPRRKLDPERTRQDILQAAYDEFVENGLSGARVDAIAARTNTVKRMIYYYFGSKEKLYLAVLEQAYRNIREVEQTLGLEDMPPVEAIRRLVEFTFNYDAANPGFVQLVSVENIHHGKYIAQSEAIQSINTAIVEILERILERGKREKVFRQDADAVDVHMLISAFCFFHVSNRHTFSVLFRRDLSDPVVGARNRALITETVLRSLEPREGA